MSWPAEQDKQWELMLADLSDSEHGLFVVLYDRSFTRDALLRRLQAEFDRQGWRLVKVTMIEDRLVPLLEAGLRDGPVKAAIVRTDDVYSSRFRPLNLEREALHALATNVLFMLSQEAYAGFLVSAHDLVTWMAPPYSFALQVAGIPELPSPSLDTPTSLEVRIQYFREQVQRAVADNKPEDAMLLLSPLADLYLAASMYNTASQAYQALITYYEQSADERQTALFVQRRDIAQGWQVLTELGADHFLLPEDRALLKRLLDARLLSVRSGRDGAVVSDEMGHTQALSSSALAILGALSERVTASTTQIASELRMRLREILVTRFSVGELRTLCFDLGIEYEDLPAEGKMGLARELIAYLERRGRIPDLVAALSRSRPDIAWRDLAALEIVPFARPSLALP